MFNKPTPTNRNDSIVRRDSPLGGYPSSGVSGATGNTTRPTGAGEPPANPASTAAPAAPSETREAGSSEARLIVGPDVKLKGAEILDCDTLVVEGRVEATMDSRVIRIAENGAFTGKVSIDVAEIHGSFEGELTARKQLIVHTTGRVSGKIRYGKLVIDEGGELRGDVNTLGEKPTAFKAPAETMPPLAAVGT